MNILKDGRLELSNNRASSQRDRHGTQELALFTEQHWRQSHGHHYKHLETAKQNGLDQFKYINYLLDKLPNEPSLLNNQHLEAYLLWSENVQPHCK